MRNWTTNALPARDQYGYWREVVIQAFTVLDPIPRSRDSFESTVCAADIAGLTVTEVSSRAQIVVRGPREIRRLLSEEFYVILQLGGGCRVSQNNREAVIRPGEFFMINAAEPYKLDFDDWNIVCFTVPHHRILPLIRSTDAALAVRKFADGGLGSITLSYMQSLKGVSEGLSEVVKEKATGHLLDLLSLNFGNDPDAPERHRESVRRGLKVAVDRFIDATIGNPDLSVAAVVERFHVSPRSLHRLFEESGISFAQSVLDKRLRRAAGLLRDASRVLPVAEVAYRSGFSDLSYFCKTFRRHYGVSAGQFRQLPPGTDATPVKLGAPRSGSRNDP